jgi:hypothetical protein
MSLRERFDQEQPGEAPGEPQEVPWPDVPLGEPPGEPLEVPWEEPDEEEEDR